MKYFNWLILIILIIISACGLPNNNIDESPIEDDYCDTYYNSFTNQNSTVVNLRISCECQDSMIDLATALLPFTSVNYLNFDCSETQFNMIPEMPSVVALNSTIVTSNIVDAFPNLSILNLANPPYLLNELNTLPLETFYLYFTRTTALPNNLNEMTNLTSLGINGSFLAAPTLNTNLGDLTNLTSLSLSSVGNIPSTFDQLTNLKYFRYQEGALPVSIPPIFDNMDSLTFVDIFNPSLSMQVQQSLYNATNIKILSINSLNMDIIAAEIGQLNQLEELTLLGNFSTVPSTISNLSNLKRFECSSSSLSNFPSGLSGLNNTLETLRITNSNLSTIPTSIGNFAILENLSFSNNNLTSLPAEIADLSDTLKFLFLSGNNFSDSMQTQIKDWLPNTTIYF